MVSARASPGSPGSPSAGRKWSCASTTHEQTPGGRKGSVTDYMNHLRQESVGRSRLRLSVRERALSGGDRTSDGERSSPRGRLNRQESRGRALHSTEQKQDELKCVRL